MVTSKKTGLFAIASGILLTSALMLSRPRKRQRGTIAGFGNVREWQDFNRRNAKFVERFGNLKRALGIAFARSSESPEPVDRVIFYLGRLCVEEFNEILVLAGNGYGVGALKLLRGMYERSVAAHYLHLHPELIDDFLDYYWVAQRKEVKAIVASFGMTALEPELVKEIEENFARVKDRFTVVDCAECGTTRLNYTWSKLDVVSMAKSGGVFGKFIVDAYYVPMRHAHTTVGAVTSRLLEAEGGTGFYGGAQRKEADSALKTAHKLMLLNLALQLERFQVEGLETLFQQCLSDVRDVWGE